MLAIQFILWLLITLPATHIPPAPHIPPTSHTPQCQPQCADVTPAAGVVMRTRDGGQTWEDLSQGLPENFQANIFHTEENISYLGTGKGLFTATSGSCRSEWKSAALAGNIIGVFPGEDGPYAVRYQDGFCQYNSKTGKWESMSGKLADQFVHVILEMEDGTLLAGCESGLYRSKNNGNSWDRVLDKGASTRLIRSGKAIIASGHHSLWRSTDNGNTWSQILGNATQPIEVRNVGNTLVAIDAGQDLPGMDFNNMLYWSEDNGSSWSVHPVAISEALSDVYDIRQAGDYLFACSSAMIWSSADNGVTWETVLRMPEEIGGFFKLETRGDALYVLRLEGC